MGIDLTRYAEAFKTPPQGIEWAEVNADLRQELALSVKNGRQSGCESFEKTAIYVRAGDGKTAGTVYSEQLDEDPAALMLEAISNARHVEQTGDQRPTTGESRQINTVTGEEVDAARLTAWASALEAAVLARCPDARVLGCSLRRTTMVRRVINTLGLDSCLKHRFYLASLHVSLPRDSTIRVSSKVLASADKLDDLDLNEIAEQAVRQADRMDGGGSLGRVSLPSGKYDCVLSADVTCNILITAWQEFVGSYITAGKSIMPSAAGAVVASDCVSIIDAPRHPNWGYHLALDSEGTVCERKDVVRNGKLVTLLHTRDSARAMGHTPTGNAGRAALLSGTVPVNILTIPSILMIEPGQLTEAQLVERMGSGVLLTYSLDEFHSINITSGEFSIPCGGIVYENGKPIGVAEQITIAGNLRDLFRSVEAVGCDLQLEEFDYKNYCFGGPSLLVKSLDVSSAG